LVKFAELEKAVPAVTHRVTPDERRTIMTARRLAVSNRFSR
jgi:hypothetical protein